MAISFPLALPGAPDYAKVEWTDNDVAGVTTAPTTLSTQTFDWQAGRWEAKVTLPIVGDRGLAADWEAFFAALHGRAGQFLLPVPRKYRAPRGSGAGNPQVDGASQAGYVLNTKGWTPSAAGVLRKADRLQIGSGLTQRVYMVLGVGGLGDVNADGAGKAALDIWPELRESPADSAPIVLYNAAAVFALASNQRTFSLDEAEIWGFTFAAVEYV